MSQDLKLRMSIIQQALTRYSRDPEKGELARGIQSQFQQPTMAKVFKAITHFIEHHPQSSLKSLRALQISITKLLRQEEKFKNLNESILCKTNKVVDFFGSLFIPNWSEKKLQEIEKARQELEILKDTVQKKIIEHQVNERLETLASLELDKKILQETILKSHAHLPLLEHEKEWLNPIFCDFYYTPRFSQLTSQAAKQFQHLQTNRERLIYLDALFKDTQALFRASVKGTPDQKLTQEPTSLMLLLVLKIDISPSLLKIESQLTEKEKKTTLGQTLSDFSAALTSIIKCSRQSSSFH